MGRTFLRAALSLTLILTTSSDLRAAPPSSGDPPGRDAILDWNAIAIQAVAEDHSGTFGTPDQGGPTRTAYALAVVHAAMYDALNSIDPQATPYFASRTVPRSMRPWPRPPAVP
ncbi:MAG: hypothetical protein ACHBNF_08430 [Chromatiales bacterium]